MENIHGFDFQPLQFDEDGNVKSGVEELATHVKQSGATDVIFMCHGFRNDEGDARELYSRFLETFAENRTRQGVAAKLGSRRFAVGGVFWPSMIFPEPEEGQGSAQSAGGGPRDRQRLEDMKSGLDAGGREQIDQMIALLSAAAADDSNAQLKMVSKLLSLVATLPVADDNEFRAAFDRAEAETLRKALLAGETLDVAPVGGGGGVMGIPGMSAQPAPAGGAQSFLGKTLGFVPRFLNLTTFLLMFRRCGVVGEKGISAAVRRVKALSGTARVHLVGHSLGGRAVTACAKGLLETPAVQADSMMLLQAAYSHFGLSQGGTTAGGVKHPRGFFRDVIEKNAVKGPILATHSEYDSVVGFAYTSMAAVSLNNARAVGDENSRFGGIGRNGVLDTKEAVGRQLNLPGEPYDFSIGKIINLNGSRTEGGKPLIDSHGDVKNAAVTWAFASLVAAT